MALKGITFSAQNVSPKNDGGLYAAHIADGALWGCSMSVSGSNLVVQRGQIIAGGRVCEFDGATNISLSGHGLTTGYIQVILNVDISQPAGSQWYTSKVTSATTTFPALTQGNVNGADSLYQMELAIVQVSGGNLSSVYSTCGRSSLITQRNMWAVNSNGDRFRIAMQNDGSFRATAVDASGNSLAGMANNSTGNLILCTNGQSIYIRPNGVANNTGEVYLDTSGQWHGGVTILESDKTSATNVTAGTWTSAICTVTLTPGIWSLTGTASFKGLGASSTNWGTLCLGHSSAATISRNTLTLCASTSTYLYANTALVYNNTSSSYTMSLYANAEAATTVGEAHLKAIQIG